MRVLGIGFLLWMAGAGAGAFADESPFSFSTGGIARLPNSQLPGDRGNAIFDGWLKAGITVLERRKSTVSLSFRTQYVSDSKGYAFNNFGTVGIELAYKRRLGKRAALTFKLRQDWSERTDGLKRDGLRFFVDYFFLNYGVPKGDAHLFGMKVKARVVTAYATLKFPETLVPGDNNITLSGGITHSTNLVIPNSDLSLSPYVALYVALDEAGLSFNNKFQPSFGVKLKHPLPNGDIHLGLRYQGDYRWKSNTFEHGPSVFVGWYSSF